MSSVAPSRPLVSVIIPVFNAEAFLGECLQSLVDQTLGFTRIEVIAVNDGSTDGSGALLNDWSAKYPNIRVIHQANSGAPGGPRNRGIEQAEGEFLFFADPDDYLGIEALERLTAAAERDGADVVLGRIKGVGRKAAIRPFRKNLAAGDIWSSHAVWSLTAHKLVRNSLVRRHGLKFAENLRLAEEQVFIVPAYFLAASVSVVADYDCYYLVRRDDASHLTMETPDPESYYANIEEVLRIVIRHTEPGEKRNALLDRWISQEILRYFRDGFAAMPAPLRDRYVERAGPLVRDLIPDEVVAGMPPFDRVRCLLLREGLTEELATVTALVPKQATGKGKPSTPAEQPPPPWFSAAGARRAARALRRRMQPAR